MSSPEELMILPCDLRRVRKGQKDGYCRPGLERWASTHGFSLRQFLKNGIPASRLEGIDDPFLVKIMEAARERAARTGGSDGVL